jgi:hypothetical protein
MAASKIFGVEILNEGWGSSIDDAVSEMQATLVARADGPMQAVQTWSPLPLALHASSYLPLLDLGRTRDEPSYYLNANARVCKEMRKVVPNSTKKLIEALDRVLLRKTI